MVAAVFSRTSPLLRRLPCRPPGGGLDRPLSGTTCRTRAKYGRLGQRNRSEPRQ